MPRKINDTILFAILVAGLLSSCVSLKSVNSLSNTATTGLKKFEDIHYGFRQHCIEECKLTHALDFKIWNDSICHCEKYEQADAVLAKIYGALYGYFDGMLKLSDKDITAYDFDNLKKQLTEGSFGKLKIEKKQVDAYSAISKILLRATTDVYRKKKIKNYIEEANEPVQELLRYFQFNLEVNLNGELRARKLALQDFYLTLAGDPKLSSYERYRILSEYHSQIAELDEMQRKVLALSKILKSIAIAHQDLYNKRQQISAKEMRAILIEYASDIQDVISEFNKLKK